MRQDPYEYKSIADQAEYLLVWQIEREQKDGWEVVQFYTPPSPWKHEINLYRCWMRRKVEGGR